MASGKQPSLHASLKVLNFVPVFCFCQQWPKCLVRGVSSVQSASVSLQQCQPSCSCQEIHLLIFPWDCCSPFTFICKLCVCVCVCVCVRVCVCACVRASKWKESARRMASMTSENHKPQWKENYRTGIGPFRQSSHCHPDKRKRQTIY